VSWSKFAFINEFNAWKNGAAADSPVNPDGSRGLAWRGEVSQDVFECASVDAAQALANFAASRTGKRKGRPVAFPRFKSRHKTAPAFRLRNRARPGTTQTMRVVGPKSLRPPTLGDIRIRGCTRMTRRMLDTGRLHLYSASIRLERGRWWVSLTGLAAPFHPARRAPSGRHPNPAGLDRGVKSLAVPTGADSAAWSSTATSTRPSTWPAGPTSIATLRRILRPPDQRYPVCTRMQRERADRHPHPGPPQGTGPGPWIGTGARPAARSAGDRTATKHPAD
jgi:putative transposase